MPPCDVLRSLSLQRLLLPGKPHCASSDPRCSRSARPHRILAPRQLAHFRAPLRRRTTTVWGTRRAAQTALQRCGNSSSRPPQRRSARATRARWTRRRRRTRGLAGPSGPGARGRGGDRPQRDDVARLMNDLPFWRRLRRRSASLCQRAGGMHREPPVPGPVTLLGWVREGALCSGQAAGVGSQQSFSFFLFSAVSFAHVVAAQ